MKYHKIFLIIISTCYSFLTNAQEFFSSREFGVLIGGSHYFGDLNTNYGLKEPNVAAGIFIKQYVNPYIAIKAAANYTKVGYNDAYSNNEFEKRRNLSFKSNIVEVNIQGEFNFFYFFTGDLKKRYTPYLTGGVGLFYFDPYTDYQGNKYQLRNIGTEGQHTADYKDRAYKPWSICFPIGVGIKYWISPGVNLGFEVVNRFTLTDYLDDVSKTYVGAQKFGGDNSNNIAAILQDRSSTIDGKKLGYEGKQRGDSATKDQYLMAQFTLSFQLKTYKCPRYMTGLLN